MLLEMPACSFHFDNTQQKDGGHQIGPEAYKNNIVSLIRLGFQRSNQTQWRIQVCIVVAMASTLVAMASTLIASNSDGLHPSSDGLHPVQSKETFRLHNQLITAKWLISSAHQPAHPPMSSDPQTCTQHQRLH